MPIPGLCRNDMVAIQKREMRTEVKLEKALQEIARLKAIIKILKAREATKKEIMYEALKEITELAPRDKLRLPYAVRVVEIADKALAKAENKPY